MEVVGAHGMLKKFPMERYYRDVRAGANHPLSNARARELIGKVALGIGPGRNAALVDPAVAAAHSRLSIDLRSALDDSPRE